MTREEYEYYLKTDREALHDYAYRPYRLYTPFCIDKEIGRFQYLLRTCEYYNSQRSKNLFFLLRKWLYAIYFKQQSIRMGYTIPPGVFGPGLRIAHRGTIVVNGRCRIGRNCTINVGVNIGMKAGLPDECPIIGNNVYIGPGAKIFGRITIADGCAIGANAVVCHDIQEPYSIVVGVPAKVVGQVSRNLHV